MIVGCDKGGRILAKLGDLELTYCGEHRKKGERVINFLIASVYGEKLQAMLRESREDLFMQNYPQLSQESYTVIGSYVQTNIHKLSELEKWEKKMKG